MLGEIDRSHSALSEALVDTVTVREDGTDQRVFVGFAHSGVSVRLLSGYGLLSGYKLQATGSS
jgi:hypothetical protein